VADWEQVEEEGNRITRWMVRFPSRDRRGGDPLGFGGGEHNRSPLGFRSVVAKVGDGGVVAEMFKLMMVLPLGGVTDLSWLRPAPPLAVKGVTPYCPTIKPTEIVGSRHRCEEHRVWR
jgi:hypothetical protein